MRQKMDIKIEQIEVMELQTRIKIINDAYDKLNKHRFSCEQLEDNFKEYFKGLVSERGGDPDLQYTLNLKEHLLTVYEDDKSNNGTKIEQNTEGDIKEN
jgi:hypothetical protein